MRGADVAENCSRARRSVLTILPRIVWPGLMASVIVFALCAYSAFFLFERHVFNQENVIFGSDPYFRSAAFSEGWGERSLIHPNLSNYINPPVRFMALLLQKVVPSLPARDLRMRISLCVSPMFSALAALMIYIIAVLAGIDVTKAAFLSLLFGFSMSTIAFGSVPDHFLISSSVLAVSLWLMQWDGVLPERLRVIYWTVLVSFAAGITISNAVPLLAVYGLNERIRRSNWFRVLVRMAVVGFFALASTLAFWGIANWIYGDFSSLQADHSYKKNIGRIGYHLSDDPLRDFLSFPIALGQSFAGGYPEVTPNPPYPKPELASYRVAYSYLLNLSRFDVFALLQLLPAVVVGLSLGVGFWRRHDQAFPVVVGVATYLAFNWLLHTFWGEELFLFSPHWHFAAVLALIPLLRFYSNRTCSWLFACSTLLVIGLNLWVWRQMLILLPTLVIQ